jgi:hypothetical protein
VIGMTTINDVLKDVLAEVKPKKPPTPAQIHRLIVQKLKAQKRLLRKRNKELELQLQQARKSA